MLLGQRTAGDPDDAAILYTDLSPNRLSQELNDLGTPVSAEPIRQWMDEHKLRLRQMSKVLTGGATDGPGHPIQKYRLLNRAISSGGQSLLFHRYQGQRVSRSALSQGKNPLYPGV